MIYLFSLVALFASLCGTAQAKTIVVSVGLDTFENGSTAVAGASYNCARVRDKFEDAVDVEVRAFCAESATRDSVLRALAEAPGQAKAGGVVVFSWIGHGYKLDGVLGLAPFDWNPDDDVTGIELERDLMPIIRMNEQVKFLLMLDARHKASQRWDTAGDTKGYVLLHGPTAGDFESLANLYVISASDRESFPEPSDPSFGNALVKALEFDSDGVLQLTTLHRNLLTTMNAVGRSSAVNGPFESGFEVAHREVEPTKQTVGWQKPTQWSALGVGSAGLILSGVEYGRVLNLNGRLAEGDYRNKTEYDEIVVGKNQAYKISVASGLIGGAVLTTGATLWVVDHLHGRRSVIVVTPTANGLSFYGRF